MVHRGTRVFIVRLWELPSRPAFVVSLRVRLYDGDIDVVSETFDMSDEVRTMSKGTEETCSMVSEMP